MRPHRFDAVSLVFGVIFGAAGLVVLRDEPRLWAMDWSWLWPAVLLVAGLLVLASIRSDQRHDRHETAAVPPDEPPEDPIDRYLNGEAVD